MADKRSVKSSQVAFSDTSRRCTPLKHQIVNLSNLGKLNASGSLHETDLFKLAVRNMTYHDFTYNLNFLLSKQDETDYNSSMRDLKDVRLDALKVFYKVWSGYTKYLKSQFDKGRVVVCPIVGTFVPGAVINELQSKMNNPEETYLMIKDEQRSEGVFYIPSQELLENLKLSYQEDSFCNLNPYFSLKGINCITVKVSFGSIAQVCDINETHVSYILRQTFQAMEAGMKNDQSIKVNLKIGSLKIRDGQLMFENYKKGPASKYDMQSMTSCNTAYKVNKKQMIRQFNIGAGSVRSFSLKSKQSSLRTPQTYSQKPSTSQKTSVERQRFINMSNPNPQHGVQQYLRLNQQQIQDINHKNGITIQGFPGVFQNGVHYRFGKRICFDQVPSQRDVLEEQLNQMQGKVNEGERHFDDQRKSENQLLKDLREQLVQEKRQKYELLMRMRNEFVKENSQRRQEKKEREMKVKQDNQDYRINFFPFTHGEQVENKRLAERGDQKDDLKNYLSMTQTKDVRKKSLNRSWLDQSYGSTGMYNNSLSGKVSTEYLTSYPHFLKPNKHYPYRRTDDSHIKNAMEVALERYEKDLLDQEKVKDRLKQNIQQIHEADVHHMHYQRHKQDAIVEENRKYLELQMEERKRRQKVEFRQGKEKVQTHYGPEENEFTVMMDRKDKQSKKQIMEVELKKQMEEKKHAAERQRELERMEELQGLAAAGQVMMSEREEYTQKDMMQKLLYRKAWEEQIKIKKQEKVIKDELLTGEQRRL